MNTLMRLSLIKAAASLLLGCLLTGCATQAPRVACHGRLQPINAPAPVTSFHTDKDITR